MTPRIAINGFGRVGRAALRAAYERELDLEFVAINDLEDDAALAHLLKHDSVYGRFAEDVQLGEGILGVVTRSGRLTLSRSRPAADPRRRSRTLSPRAAGPRARVAEPDR